ncbi:hypothetical protein [Micromonospora auratinigra]|uniref:Uncharacterized protein n=1 Tax=Micromonospora auratinigra TaxID=261654 RepID=A0A1A9A363_9ACTN|nr:hypothetical protein [Micromonospora auratinigra]SBT50609.1 hypothetical protein GA0070611_4832 [Micromonospora auratinigra]
MGEDDEAAAQPDVPAAEPEAGVARRGPTWVILAVVAATLVVCCCSAVIGVGLSWSTGLLGGR